MACCKGTGAEGAACSIVGWFSRASRAASSSASSMRTCSRGSKRFAPWGATLKERHNLMQGLLHMTQVPRMHEVCVVQASMASMACDEVHGVQANRPWHEEF